MLIPQSSLFLSLSLFLLAATVQASPAPQPIEYGGGRRVPINEHARILGYRPPLRDSKGYPLHFWDNNLHERRRFTEIRKHAPPFPFRHPMEVPWPGEEGQEEEVEFLKSNMKIMKCWGDWVCHSFIFLY